MIYIVQVYSDLTGVMVFERQVYGMVEVDRVLAVYAEQEGYTVHWEPDVFRYLGLNRSEALS